MQDQITDDWQNDVIGEIYEASLDPARWSGIVRTVADRLDAIGSSICTPLSLGLGFEAIWATTGDEAFVTQYAEKYAHQDFLANAILRRVPMADAIFTLDDFGDREFIIEHDPVYRDLLAPRGVRQFVALAAGATDHRFCCFNLYAPDWSTESEENYRRFLNLIRPHVSRSLRIHWHLASARQSALASRVTLDMFSAGVAWVTLSGEIVFQNEEMTRILAQRDGLLVADGRLMASSSDGVAIRSAIEQAANGRDTYLRIDRPSGPHYTMLLVPLPAVASAFRFPNTAAIVFVSEAEPSIDRRISAFARAHGLTKSEADIAQHIAHGATAAEIAERNEVAISTVRTQIKAILAKTGLARQADLIVAFAGLPRI